MREESRVANAPGRVSPRVVHYDAGVGGVAHVDESVVAGAVTAAAIVVLVVQHQVCQQSVGSQHFRRQGDAANLQSKTLNCKGNTFAIA